MAGITGNHLTPSCTCIERFSGQQGAIRWLNGYRFFFVVRLNRRTDGDQNGQLTINFLKQLGTFFSQPRYVNIVTMVSYTLVEVTDFN